MFYDEFTNQINKQAMKRVWADKESYVMGYDFQHGYISERLTKERVSQWNCQTPVFISAQTGAGKSTLIMDTLLPIMKERGKKIAICCSRSVLAQQMKRNAAKCELPDMAPELVDATIKYGNRCNWGNVDVFTYQELALRMEDEKFCRNFQYYGAVICDEAHFFVEDAAFNRFTEQVFEFILKYAQRAVRVYLSATPEPVADLIADKEWDKVKIRNHPYWPSQCFTPYFLFYNFRRDYSYVNPFFFEDWEFIIDEIKKDRTDDKWLIFVDRKETGRNLAEALGAQRALYVDADRKNNELSEAMAKLTEDKQFQIKVLIVTKFLDVGVDIWDSSLKKVVISTFSKTNFLQSIGRKRIKKDESLTLYIRIPDPEELSKKMQEIGMKKREVIENKKLFKQKNLILTDLLYPFFLEVHQGKTPRLSYNDFVFNAFAIQLKDLKELLSYEKRGGKKAMAKLYLQWMDCKDLDREIRWLGKPQTDEQEQLEEFLSEWINQEMDRDKYLEFKQELKVWIQKHCSNLIDIRAGREIGTKTIRDLFIQFKVAYNIKNIKTGIWILERG
ncbi:MAG: DEAD/DEAH box helicase family protein [Lachnospiraceae bacterium]|nr:DEAD/DEAH box helicase family protein [Lachnospiraceae bacterium]